MTYFGFLLRFLGIPLVVFVILTLRDLRRGQPATGFAGDRATWKAIGLLVLVAVVYTTPWDNYLVASGVWYYQPRLISGILLGWVPLEEYLFFILETVLTGLWWRFLARRLPLTGTFKPDKTMRIALPAILGIIWLVSLLLLGMGWKPGTYLSLILAWGLPPVMLQFAFGEDILWHHQRLVILAILPVFLYISAADSLAISGGTWTIDPAQSTGLFIGPLPVEEAVFFLITIVMISFGLTLALSRASSSRWKMPARQPARDRGEGAPQSAWPVSDGPDR